MFGKLRANWMPTSVVTLITIITLLFPLTKLIAKNTMPLSQPNKPGGKIVERPSVAIATLKTQFKIRENGTLVLAYPPDGHSGWPVEAFEKLYVLIPGKSRAIEISRLEDLCGRVAIESPESALDFCRLRTSPVTWFLWEQSAVEVVSEKQVDTAFCFGNDVVSRELTKTNLSGYMGVVKSSLELSKLGVEPASVKVTSTGFEVRRTLLAEKPKKPGSFHLLDVIECVAPDGKYMCRVVREREVPKIEGLDLGITGGFL